MRRVDGVRVAQDEAGRGERGSGLEVEAVAQGRADDFKAERPAECGEGVDPRLIGAGREADVEPLADAQNVAAVEVAALDPVEREVAGKPGGGGLHFVRPARGAGAGEDCVIAEQHGGVLDEHRVGIAGQIGQPNDFEPGLAQRLLISGMLNNGARGVDRNAALMGQLAIGEARADGAGESAGHQRDSLRQRAERDQGSVSANALKFAIVTRFGAFCATFAGATAAVGRLLGE